MLSSCRVALSGETGLPQREQVERQHPQHAKPNRRDSEPAGDAAEGIWQPRCKSSSAKHEKGCRWRPLTSRYASGGNALFAAMDLRDSEYWRELQRECWRELQT